MKIINKIGKLLPDKLFLSLNYYHMFNKWINWKNPRTFNEKLQWLKLYDRKPVYTTMVDKYEAKQYVASIIGKEYVIPVLGVWNRFEDIDFSSLPNQFVLKCTHDSGGLIICKDKSKLDYDAARRKITKSLKRNYYYAGREWPYKNVKPRVIAEKYMENSLTANFPDYDLMKNDNKVLADYKLFCFNGKVRCLYVSDSINHKIQFYDENYNVLDIERFDYERFDVLPQKPTNFDMMKQLAQQLSKNIPHVRVDFYEVDGKVYFGEMTFFTASGFIPFKEEKWDRLLGSWLNLSLGSK